MAFFSNDHLNFYYEDEGGSSRTSNPRICVKWRVNWVDTGWRDALMKVFPVIIFDHRGHGNLINHTMWTSTYQKKWQ